MACFPETSAQKLKYFFTDIDDTVSTSGIITADAYDAIWKLFKHGIHVIPVTGRPAGWCDHIARMWPVEAVIGENGAFYFSYNRQTHNMQRVFLQSEYDRKYGTNLLKELQKRVLSEVPGCAISSDQPYRIADLAIDFCEDVDPLSKTDIQRICQIADDLSLTSKISSIHVNCWYGKFNKLSCLKHFISEHYKTTLAKIQLEMLFIGDSPNDEPMFAEVKQSVAVANIINFWDSLTYYPSYITDAQSGTGFREAVDCILSKRSEK
ncbi:HAD-IIB family hydrolase [bacterium]|nr:HAD-IIB family hydrolase [bacterium]